MAARPVLRITYQAQTYVFEPYRATLRDAGQIKAHTGKAFLRWESTVYQGEVEDLQALWWLMNRQAGRDVDINDAELLVLELLDAYAEAWVAARKQTDGEQEADPTEGRSTADPTGSTTSSTTSETATST